MKEAKARWAVRGRDGWHYSRPNRPHRQDAANVGTACGYFIVLPYGCEQRVVVDCPTCEAKFNG